MRIELDDLVEQINEDIAMVRAELDDIRDEAQQTDDPDEFDELERDAEDAQDLLRELENKRDVVQEKQEKWGGQTFVIKDLTWGDRQKIDDTVRAQTVRENVEDTTAMMGAYKLAFVNHAVSQTPAGAPNKAGDYPAAIGDWLYSQAEAYNTAGEVDDMGNGSPLGDIKRPDGQQNSSGTE